MTWTADGPQGNEAAKIKWELVPYTRGKGLDLGCGPYKAFPHFIGVDNGNHAQFGWNIKPDVFVPSCEDLSLFASQSMDFVFSSHLLEHIKDHKKALKEWWRVLKVGGYLCLYLPHKSFYPNIGQPGSNPDHKHDFLPSDVMEAMKEIGCWDLVENQERNEGNEYSFFQVYKKAQSKHRESWKEPKPAKSVGVVRYGGIGDMLMAASVFKGLKDQGYHVTLYTTPRGWEVVKHDPNVDAVCLQDDDQVPNGELRQWWDHLEKKHHKFVNLSETVEASFLAIDGRTARFWPQRARHLALNVNYIDIQHAVAEIDSKPAVRFYATEDEKRWARKERGDKPFVVLYALSGSSVHKVWPHMDAFLARIFLTYKDAHVYTTGDATGQILEAGWEKEPRLHMRAGKWTVRETLAFALQADMVIGPETGVLNAVCQEPMPKILFLSHSSHENLSRDWVNTSALEPRGTKCYPCHMMHYSWDTCVKHESGTAQCAWDISVDDAWGAVKRHMEQAA